jgi:N-acetylmuramate 1-kinase
MSRCHEIQKWLGTFIEAPFSLEPITPGAGSRRYFRVTASTSQWVVMDSPIDEKLSSFIRLAKALTALGMRVPTVHAADMNQGFLLLSDLGENLYGNILNEENADKLYHQALTSLVRLQTYPLTETGMPEETHCALKPFDHVHYREKMQWFIDFFLHRHLAIVLTPQQQLECEQLFDLLVLTADQQPKVCVHYDYHSRNLIHSADGQIGVLDFQDAVYGPITYDLMSLLRDCYIDWPASRVQQWQAQYRQMALQAGVLPNEDPEVWNRWCDFSSAQRHIKCIGLFARFHVLGQTSDYLIYIPRLLNYLREISARHPEMFCLRSILEKLPR